MGNPIPFLLMHVYVQFVLAPAFIAYTLLTGRTSAYHVVRHICEVLRVKFLKVKDSNKLETGCVYLCNHRSWADFFVDQSICGGGAYLSRLMVWVGTPISSLWAWLSHSTWYFNRKPGIDRNAFGFWIDSQWQQRSKLGLIAYPEGTRNTLAHPLRLKSGVLQYAYEYKRPIQVVITTNKESVVNEKKLKIGWDTLCVTCISSVLDPKDFQDPAEFIEKARTLFSETWDRAYSCKPEDAEIYEPPFGLKRPEFDDVPIRLRLWILRFASATLVAYYLYQRRKSVITA